MSVARFTSHAARTTASALAFTLLAPSHARAQTQLVADQPQTPATTTTLQPGTIALDGERRHVTKLDLFYLREVAGAPPLADILAGTVELAEVNGAWTPPYEGLPTQQVALRDIGTIGPQYLHDSTLSIISRAVADRIKQLGIIGVYAEPDTTQFRLSETGIIDARAATDTSLRIGIALGFVQNIRTIAQGERIDPQSAENNPIHAWIHTHSPLSTTHPHAIDRIALDDYLFRINRHPSRQVDAAAAPTGDDSGATNIDFLVAEARPWTAFVQATRDGRRDDDEWRYLFGFTHNQLTNHDDILAFTYRTSLDNVNTLQASYDRPIDDARRLRAKVQGSYYAYTSADVGQSGATFEGDGWNTSAELTFNFYQNADLFIDAIAGARVDKIRVDNQFADVTADETITVAYIGARLEQYRAASATSASIMLEFSIDGLDGESVDTLGRFNADENWATIKLDASHSFSLDSLFDRSISQFTLPTHELALTSKAQLSLGSRLAPNYQDVIGGLYTVRGYPESIVAGDNSFAASIEYRLHLPRSFAPREEPGSLFGNPFRWRPQYPAGPIDWDLIFRSFLDVGYVSQVDRESFERDNTLIGAGVGLEFVLVRHAVMRLDYGWALSEVEDGAGNAIVDVGDNQWHFVATFIF